MKFSKMLLTASPPILFQIYGLYSLAFPAFCLITLEKAISGTGEQLIL
jgi:hypothetical protein